MSRAKTPAKNRSEGRKKPAISPKNKLFTSGIKSNAVLCVLLAAVTIALYSPVASYSFIVLDDHDYVTANPHIHAGLAWNTVKWAFASTDAANWHPLTWLSHAFDYQLFALNSAGHHLDSVLIHAINAVLLFLLLQWITRRSWISLFVAALFALHPLNVESVAWVSERKNVLSTFFFLLAIAAYVRYAQKPDWQRYLTVAALFAAGLMAKPMVITLPFVLLLLDYWPLNRIHVKRAWEDSPPAPIPVPQRSVSSLLLEKIPLLFLSAASAVITMKAQSGGHAVRTLHQFPVFIRLENATLAYGLYLWKMIWPAHLALYPHSAIAVPPWQWILSGSILIAITALVIIFRAKRHLLVGWFWFLGTLIPVIGLIQVGEASMADRYAYLPLIGIFIMISMGLADLAKTKNVPKIWLMIPALAALTALSFATHRQMSYWASDYDLWSHTLAIGENPIAHDALGSVLMDPGMVLSASAEDSLDTEEKRLDEARRHFERAQAMRVELAKQNPAIYLPDTATTLNNLGNLDRIENQPDLARQHYDEALKIHYQLAQQNLDPYPADLALTLNNLGSLEKATPQEDEARQHFEDALTIYRRLAERDPDAYLPKVAETLNNLGFVQRDQKHLEESRKSYEQALKIRRQLTEQDRDTYLPCLAITLNDLAILDSVQNRPNEAHQHYEEALAAYRELAQKDPDTYRRYLAATLNNLAFLDESQNRLPEALALYKEDVDIFRELYQQNPDQYAGDVSRVESSLEELQRKLPPNTNKDASAK